MNRDAGLTSAFYPFIIRSTAASPDGAIFGLGHGLGVVLLREREGLGRVVRRDELEALGLDPSAAYLRAASRLSHLFESRLLPYDAVMSRSGRRCVVFNHRMLGASCILLPAVYELAARLIGCEALCAALPRRDRLVVFANPGAASRAETRRDIVASFASANIALTTELFVLDEGGPSAVITSPARMVEIDIEVDFGLDAEDAA